MTSKELINILKAKPNAKIIIASDEEGNSFGTIEPESIEINKDKIIIYPYHQFLELDEADEIVEKEFLKVEYTDESEKKLADKDLKIEF